MSFEQEDIWREAKYLAQSKAVAEIIRRIEQRQIN